MMAEFAVIENNKVINIIVADDKETAESVVNKTCIAVDTEAAFPQVGWSVVDGVIINPETIVEETPAE